MRKIMMHTLRIWIMLVSVVGLTFCTEDKEHVELFVSVSEISVKAAGESISIIVTSNSTWSVTDTSNWIIVTPKEGNGNDTLVIDIEENPLETSRSTVIAVMADDKHVEITLTQAANKKEELIPTLGISHENIQFNDNGGDTIVDIESNYTWAINTNADWISVAAESDSGNAEIHITVEANKLEEERQTTLTITAGDITKEIVIYQDAYVLIIVYDIPPDDTDMRDITSVEFSKLFGAGWNVGNSLDAIGGETNWGNPLITQKLIDSVKTAGFNFIRLPVAWSKFSNASNFTIQQSWLDRVEEVVNYVLNNDMYVMINIHWDGGWMQPTYKQQEYVNNRLEIMWKQIATHFRDYNDRVLFAGTNEVMVEGDYGTPTKEYYTVQNGFNQVFVNTVRSTGGRNAYRHLIVQGFNTNINHAVSFAKIPRDVIENRLMMEVHYYDPYNYALNKDSKIWQWGKNATESSATETWANETYVDGQFNKMKTKFIDNGIAVIMGEYGAIAKMDYTGYQTYREYYIKYITQAMADRGIIPVYWDNGYTFKNEFGLFNRNTGEQAFPEIIEAIVGPFQ